MPSSRRSTWTRHTRDHPLPIGHGQTISQPYIVALMSEQAGIGKGDHVLEIGTGSDTRPPFWRSWAPR